MSSDDLNRLLFKWYEAKKDLAHQEEKVNRYKTRVEKLMKDTNHLASTDFIVDKRSYTRESVSKTSIPDDVWKRYATKATYSAYYLKKK